MCYTQVIQRYTGSIVGNSTQEEQAVLAGSSRKRERLEQVHKVIFSSTLHGADSLRKLLRYLAERSLDDPGHSIKEFQIATDVLGRGAEFDPRIDSLVRVKVARLRAKLSDYYGGEGKQDPIKLEIPKGSYSVLFKQRWPVNGPPKAPTAQTPSRRPAMHAGAIGERRSLTQSTLVLVLGAISVTATALLFVDYRLNHRFASEARAGSSSAADLFWREFLVAGEKPIVVYSNARFVGRASTGLRYFDPATDNIEDVLDHYTGVGEVMAIHELTRFFGRRDRDVEVKRALLLTWDDVKQTNVIFVGAPSENPPLRELRREGNFRFERGVLVNQEPLSGEPAFFRGSPTSDHAIIRLTEGLTPKYRMLILAGGTTMGTHAAVEFVCRSEELQELVTMLGASADAAIGPFEAVLRVEISGGVPVETSVAALRQGDSPR